MINFEQVAISQVRLLMSTYPGMMKHWQYAGYLEDPQKMGWGTPVWENNETCEYAGQIPLLDESEEIFSRIMANPEITDRKRTIIAEIGNSILAKEQKKTVCDMPEQKIIFPKKELPCKPHSIFTWIWNHCAGSPKAMRT